MSTEQAAHQLRQNLDTWQAPLLKELEAAERNQDWLRVEALCKQILQRDGENWAIWQRMALSLEAREDWTQAETLWRHLTQRFGQRPEPYLALASLQRQRGAPDAARVVLEQAERLLGSSPDLRESLKLIDDPWAGGDAVVSLEGNATAAAVAAALQKGQEHLETGRHAEAEAVFAQLVLARPLAVQFHRTLAQMRLRRGDRPSVVEQLLPLFQPQLRSEQLLERLELPLLLLDALCQEQRWLEAEELLPRFLQRAPEDPRLLYIQGRCALEAGRDNEALPLLKHTLQLAPTLTVAAQTLGQLQARLGDWDAAINLLEQVVAQRPDLEEAATALDHARRERLWERGESALARGDWLEAERQFRALVNLGQESRALARLDLLGSLEPSRLSPPGSAEASSADPAATRLQQFSITLDRLESILNRP